MTHLRNTGIFYVALSGLFFGFIGYFGMSLIHAHLSVNNMLFWRFFISTIVMGIIVLLQIEQMGTPLIDLVKGFIYGALLYGPGTGLYFIAADNIGSGLAMVIFYTFPAMVMLFNFVFHKDKIGIFYLVSILLIFVGMGILSFGGPLKLNAFGVEMSLISALLFAIYIIISKSSQAPAQVDTLMVCLGSSFSALILAKVEHRFGVPQTLGVWVNILGIGTICTAIPILLLLKGLKHIGALQASLLSILEPVFVVIFGVVLLHEQIIFLQIIGIVILLIGALLATLGES